MDKKTIYFLGLLTLIAFPLVALFSLWFFSAKNPLEILEINNLPLDYIFFGLLFGIFYALCSIYLFNRPYFENELRSQRKMVLSLNLNIFDKFFLSFSAGFGEEILFRAGIQHYLGIWITSIIFIAIHGYLNPKKPRLAIYGLFLIPFIVVLGFSYDKFGLWSIIAAHFSYDFVLFLFIKNNEKDLRTENDLRD